MRRLATLALSLVALVACSDGLSAPRTPRVVGARPALDAVAIVDAVPADTALTLVMQMGESADLEQDVLAKLRLNEATDCRFASDIAYIAYGRLIASAPGEALVVCNGGRHVRLMQPDEADSPEESWSWAPFTFLLRVEAQEG